MPSGTPDYYFILRISASATAEEIKIAYRNRAKALHPDKNKGRNTTKAFQLVQEAYSVLGSAERRKLYDEGNLKEAVDPATEATEVIWEAESCQMCECVSAQLRFISYDTVVSFAFYCRATTKSGIFCPACASKKLFKASIVTGSFGWTGFLGFSKSFKAFFKNISGGDQKPDINALVLARQAAYFYQEQEFDIARILVSQAMKFDPLLHKHVKYNKKGLAGINLTEIENSGSENNNRRLISKWGGWPLAGRYSLLGFAIPISLWVVLLFTILSLYSSSLSASKKNGSITAIPIIDLSSAKVLAVAPPSNKKPLADHLMVASDGYTYRVNDLDYQRLVSILLKLTAIKSNIDKEGRQLSQECANVDYAKKTNSTKSQASLNAVNTMVNAYEAKLEDYKKVNEEYNKAVIEFNKDLEKTGTRLSK